MRFAFFSKWSAKCTYLTQVRIHTKIDRIDDLNILLNNITLFNHQVGNRYAALIGDKSPEPSITKFFGFFFMVFQTSQIWGNLISSLGIFFVHFFSTYIQNQESLTWI